MKAKKYGRISQAELTLILNELAAWGRGERGANLTWDRLEALVGFSRQALSANDKIHSAYADAQASLKLLPKTREEAGQAFAELEQRLQESQEEVHTLCAQADEWRARWQRIAYHLMLQGISMSQLDRPPRQPLPDEHETAQILRPFDKPIPKGRSSE